MVGLEFFYQLTEFSHRYVSHMGLKESISPWGNEFYSDGRPKGSIIHYTADEDFHRVLRWILIERYQARVSAHVVVADCKMPMHDECAEGLPLVQKLPVTVVQTRKHDTVAIHATWTNGFTFGIENVCAGELRLGENGWVTLRPRDKSAPKWTAPWEPRVTKIPVSLYGRWWAPYTEGQIIANIQILRHLHEIYPLQPEWILSHDAIKSKKRDAGPAYPIHSVRDEIFVNSSFEDRVWFQNFKADPLYGHSWRDAELKKWAKWLFGQDQNWTPDLVKSRFKIFLNAWKAATYLGLPGVVCMRLLGYYVPNTMEMYLDPDKLISVEIFRRMSGLDQADNATVPEALESRLYDRGILK